MIRRAVEDQRRVKPEVSRVAVAIWTFDLGQLIYFGGNRMREVRSVAI